MNDQNNVGQTAIHLSLDWPIDIKVLFDAKADLNRVDEFDCTPIEHAFRLSLPETVRLLAGDGSALEVNRERFLDLAMQTEANVQEKIVDYIIELVSDRRRQLRKLTLSSLPTSVLKELKLSQDRLLNEHAMSTISMLKKHNVTVPDALILGLMRTTIYHGRYLTARNADKL